LSINERYNDRVTNYVRIIFIINRGKQGKSNLFPTPYAAVPVFHSRTRLYVTNPSISSGISVHNLIDEYCRTGIGPTDVLGDSIFGFAGCLVVSEAIVNNAFKRKTRLFPVSKEFAGYRKTPFGDVDCLKSKLEENQF